MRCLMNFVFFNQLLSISHNKASSAPFLSILGFILYLWEMELPAVFIKLNLFT